MGQAPNYYNLSLKGWEFCFYFWLLVSTFTLTDQQGQAIDNIKIYLLKLLWS